MYHRLYSAKAAKMCRVFAVQVGPVHVQVMGRDRLNKISVEITHASTFSG